MRSSRRTLGFVKRDTLEEKFALEIDRVVDKGMLSSIVYKCFVAHGAAKTSIMLDDIQTHGLCVFHQRRGVTIGIADMEVPEAKTEILERADVEVNAIYKNFTRGLYTEEERKKKNDRRMDKSD